VFHCERGSEVAAGDPLVSVYAQDAARRDELAAAMRSIIQTKTAPVERKPSMIIEVW
jgi:thymidine phosphorylase